jgi:hypothetical protein
MPLRLEPGSELLLLLLLLLRVRASSKTAFWRRKPRAHSAAKDLGVKGPSGVLAAAWPSW